MDGGKGMIPVLWQIFSRRHDRLAAEQALLDALHGGAVLKAHRTVDGAKVHQLHRQDAPPVLVDVATVRRLEEQQLIQSNMKFPAATYLLTEQGALLINATRETKTTPLTIRTAVNMR